MQTVGMFLIWSCDGIKGETSATKTDLSPKVAFLASLVFANASVVSYVALVLSLLLLFPSSLVATGRLCFMIMALLGSFYE